MDAKKEEDCKCAKLEGHLEAVKWLLWRRKYYKIPAHLALGEWTTDPFIWLYYVESSDGLVPDDDALLTTDTRYWSIHNVQRYFVGELHCERALFTYQYPNLKLPTSLGRHLWRANTALKTPPNLYTKELNISIEHTLKKMESNEDQVDRLIISDQLVNIDRLDCFKRRTFFRILLNILSFQDSLQLVSFENLRCKRLEGVRLIQQLACFNADTLKYLFLWRFVLPNENPILINYSYITVPCVSFLSIIGFYIGGFFTHYNQVVNTKLNEIISTNQLCNEGQNVAEKALSSDPNKPWRTNTSKEKLLRIDGELKRHLEKGTELIMPLSDGEMKDLVEECTENSTEESLCTTTKLKAIVDAARKDLPNFQYRNIENSTATAILRDVQY